MRTLLLKLGTGFLMSLTALFLTLPLFAAQEEFRYDAGEQRNPFIPLVTSEGRLLQLEKKAEKVKGDVDLEGIIYDPYGVSYAIVNGGVVKIGDSVGDSQVLKIEKTRILFIKDGEVSVLELKKEGKGDEKK